VVGRKNWLFSGHPRGASASAFLYLVVAKNRQKEVKKRSKKTCGSPWDMV
jgi:hypothetical protein